MSKRQARRSINANLNSWQACQHCQRFTPMITLTFTIKLSYKQLRSLLLLLMLFLM